MHDTRRSWPGRLGLGVGALVASLVVAEVAVRVRAVPPRAQLVAECGVHAEDGVPIWDDGQGRENVECAERHPDRTRVAFFGSSVTYGSDLPAEESFPAVLERRLNAARPAPGFCVMNFARAGFAFERYAMLGDVALGVHGYLRRADGYVGIDGVPDALNRFAFDHSRLYRDAAIAFGARSGRSDARAETTEFAATRLGQVPDAARASGSKLVTYLAPPLDWPFPEYAASPPEWHGPLEDFARSRGIPVWSLARELAGDDYLALRRDACCHYDTAGHRRLAEVFERIVLATLDGAPPPQRAP